MRTVGLGETEFDRLQQFPPFRDAWGEVERRFKAEGTPLLDVDRAKKDFVDTYYQLSSPGKFTASAEQAVRGAKEYVIYGRTIAGAVSTISGLVQAATSGAPPQELAKVFSGAMIGTLVAAGALSAGIGAAITAGIAIVFSALEEAGLISGPKGVEICPGVRCDPPPTFVVGCLCVYGDLILSPDSSNWRPFPDPNNPDDQQWFDYRTGRVVGVIKWRGADFRGPAYERMIDTAFSEFFHLECQQRLAPSGPVGDFKRAFLSAWKINKAFALNGMKPAEDWQVFLQTVNIWNRAHEPGIGFEFMPLGTRSDIVWADRFNGCPTRMYAYESILVTDVINRSPKDAPNNRIRINTGSLKSSGSLSLIHRSVIARDLGLNQTASSGSSIATKVITGTAITAAVSAAALAAYAYYNKITFGAALTKVVNTGKNTVRSTVHTITSRKNPIDLPQLAPSKKTNKGRRLAYRVRLDGSAPIEYVQMTSSSDAVLYRSGQPIARFRPAKYQLAKIRAGDGELLIFADQLL